MSLIEIALFSMIVSASAFAAGNNATELSGADAQELYTALGNIGAFYDSGIGHIGTTASDLSCAVDKFNPQTNSCILKVQNQSGGMTRKILNGKKANILINALTDVGIGGCGMENCGGYNAKSIDCTAPLDPNADANDTICTIQN